VIVAQVGKLVAPEEPELREAVEEEKGLSLAAGDVVKAAFLEVREVMFELARWDGRGSLS
jgi:hypothetical protein